MRNPLGVTRVADALEAEFGILRRRPFTGLPGHSAGTREKSVVHYPYVIVYEVFGHAVVILGVFHTAQGERTL